MHISIILLLRQNDDKKKLEYFIRGNRIECYFITNMHTYGKRSLDGITDTIIHSVFILTSAKFGWNNAKYTLLSALFQFTYDIKIIRTA